MSNWLNRLKTDDRGNAVLEFAFMMPFLLLLFSGLTEVGRAYFQANAVEKGLRAAVLYAARAPSPLGVGDALITENILKTGTADGTGDLLVSGWSQPGAGFTITTTNFDMAGTSIPVIRINARVPFDPIVPEMAAFVGLDNFTLDLSHEQAHVGL